MIKDQAEMLYSEGNKNKFTNSKDDIVKEQEEDIRIKIVKNALRNKTNTLNKKDISSYSFQLQCFFFFFFFFF